MRLSIPTNLSNAGLLFRGSFDAVVLLAVAFQNHHISSRLGIEELLLAALQDGRYERAVYLHADRLCELLKPVSRQRALRFIHGCRRLLLLRIQPETACVTDAKLYIAPEDILPNGLSTLGDRT